MLYVRTVKTASGAMAVQIVSHRGSRDIEHIGSAHDEVELELLKSAVRQRLAAGQGELAGAEVGAGLARGFHPAVEFGGRVMRGERRGTASAARGPSHRRAGAAATFGTTSRRHRLFEHAQAVQLGVPRLDDPGQHQAAEHLVTAGRQAEAQHLVSVLQGDSASRTSILALTAAYSSATTRLTILA